MLNVDAALGKLLDSVEPVDGSEVVPVADALDRIAADDIAAPVDLPPFAASAMDGYAVAAAGFAGEPPHLVELIGESRAGHPSSVRVAGTNAVRIFTGATIPEGADAVVIQEDARVDHGAVALLATPRRGDNVRPRGHDVLRGSPIARRGDRLDAYRLSWLTACGIDHVEVRRRVKVTVFSTGDELMDTGKPLGPGQIYDSNRFALARLMSDQPVDLTDLGCLPDSRDAIRAALEQAAGNADMVLTSGGVSVGDADYVRDIVEEIGRLEFYRIALKPGKPLAVGKIGDADFFGLPGNPISTIVTFLLFVIPALAVRSGGRHVPPLEFHAVLGENIGHSAGRREYQRGIAENADGGLIVRSTGDQSSNRLSTFDGANCLIRVPEERGDLAAGETVSIVLLRDRGRLF
ncbi:MAG: molybdopterin molybdotransferase MoeA [Gammaproteobacteria bacterium]|nr:molybdopterin molybdotransferase MoeA [Gammaproteobacteria bacterium]